MKKFELPQILVLLAVATVGILYFGFSTVNKDRKGIDQKRALVANTVSINTLVRNAKSTVSAESLASIEAFEIQLEKSRSEEDKVETMKELASRWYRLGHPAISGYYAEKIAETLKTDAQAWSIAGTTYTLGIQKATDDKVREFCGTKARMSFESAISIEPEELSHRINLAVAITEFPSSDNPMQGVLMLRELVEANPDNATLQYQLGRFALQTGQVDKAIERLEKAIELQPESSAVSCLLGKAYAQAGLEAQAAELLKNCN